MRSTPTFDRTPHVHVHLPVDFGAILTNLGHMLHHKWESFLISMETRSEPRIWTTSDRHGNMSWHVFDPETNQSWTFNSEEEVRICLEERYSF